MSETTKHAELCSCNRKPWFPLTARGTVNGFERFISFKPGFVCEVDWNGPNRYRSHGQHGLDLILAVKGPKGVVHFSLYTGWTPNLSFQDYDQRIRMPMPAGVDYHSPVPRYEEQTVANEHCTWLDDRPCYCDGSPSGGDKVFTKLITEGEDAAFAELEEYYRAWLEKEDA